MKVQVCETVVHAVSGHAGGSCDVTWSSVFRVSVGYVIVSVCQHLWGYEPWFKEGKWLQNEVKRIWGAVSTKRGARVVKDPFPLWSLALVCC